MRQHFPFTIDAPPPLLEGSGFHGVHALPCSPTHSYVYWELSEEDFREDSWFLLVQGPRQEPSPLRPLETAVGMCRVETPPGEVRRFLLARGGKAGAEGISPAPAIRYAAPSITTPGGHPDEEEMRTSFPYFGRFSPPREEP